MGEPCQYVYRYNGNEKTEEVEVDATGDVPMPERGDILRRNGQLWKVIMVSTQRELSPNPPLPVHRVMLTDNLKLAI